MKMYSALAYEFKDRPGVYIGDESFETTNVNYAFLYVSKDGLAPDITECINQASIDEENHKKYLENNFEKVGVNNYKPYTWLEYCNLVEVEINEDTFSFIAEGE